MAKVVNMVISASNDEDGVANAMYWYVLWASVQAWKFGLN